MATARVRTDASADWLKTFLIEFERVASLLLIAPWQMDAKDKGMDTRVAAAVSDGQVGYFGVLPIW